MDEHCIWLKRCLLICAVAAIAMLPAAAPPALGALRVRQTLTARSPDSGAGGHASVIVRRVRRGVDRTLLVVVQNLDARTCRDVAQVLETMSTNRESWESTVQMERMFFRRKASLRDNLSGVLVPRLWV